MYKVENNVNMKNCTKIRLFASPSSTSETNLRELSLVLFSDSLGLESVF